ncbi:MAG TPA: protoglobin domain-containing protein [Kofleriaceae bacterium]
MILEELLGYVQLDAIDRSRLSELHTRLEPSFAAIAARFYEALLASPAATLLQGPEQVERLRVTLIDWMSSGLRGPYDEAFAAKRARIGKRHVAVGLAQHYMFAAIDVVRVAYLDRIAELYPAREALDVVRSVDKLFDVELALMLRHYQLDSEQRLVDRERQVQTDRLSSLQTLTSGLAHEVRNPLNSAALQLDLVERRLRKGAHDPKLTGPIGLARQEIHRLARMLDEFLAFARPGALALGAYDVVELVHQVVQSESALATTYLTELLVDAPAPVVCEIDAAKVLQIVRNLVRNAIEAAPKGHVVIHVGATPSAACIRVRDDGTGIPIELLPRIYEPFFSTKPEGTGMGMSIVHSLVATHNGHVDVTTGPHGTEVAVSLPCAFSS